jgi:hypothetical protein
MFRKFIIALLAGVVEVWGICYIENIYKFIDFREWYWFPVTITYFIVVFITITIITFWREL